MRMRFGRGARNDEPEINLIPFIDVLLVVLIFLMLSTTYGKFTEMQLRLPVADAEPQRERPKEVVVAVSADGRYAVGGAPLAGHGVEDVAAALGAAAMAGGGKDAMVVVSADANATHQSVVTVLEAARRAGLAQLTFAAQAPARAAR